MRQDRLVAGCVAMVVVAWALETSAWGIRPPLAAGTWAAASLRTATQQAAGAAAPQGEGTQGASKSPFDPVPAENPTEPGLTTSSPEGVAVQAAKEIVLISDEKAFASLAPPKPVTLAVTDPRGDWLRLGPKEPPKPGETLEVFPPKIALPPVPTAVVPALEVLRHYPSGDEVTSDVISVSFNQPVGTLTTLAQQVDGKSWMQVNPAVQGDFQWLGAGTLAFNVPPRLPIATEFQVTVPAGVAVPGGLPLAQEYSFRFATPLPAVTNMSPYEDDVVGLQPTLEISFNGQMDPNSVMEHVTLKGPGGAKVALRMLSVDWRSQVETLRKTDPVAARELELKLGSTVQLTPVKPLKMASGYTLSVLPGVASLEGPLPGKTGRSVSFQTYSPLRIDDIGCSWEPGQNEPCDTWSTIYILFNNDLDMARVKDLVKISPAVDELEVEISGYSVALSGRFQPSTTYTVTMKPGAKDIYAQVEKKGFTKKLRFVAATPEIQLNAKEFSVLEADYAPQLELLTVGLKQAQAQFYSVEMKDLAAAILALSRGDYTEHGAGKDMGLEVSKRQPLKFTGNSNSWTPYILDLKPLLGTKPYGIVLVEVSARVQSYGEWERRVEMTLAQITGMGLTVVADSSSVHTSVAELATGKPKPGVDVSLYSLKGFKELAKGRTDSTGLVRLELGDLDIGDSPTVVVVAKSGFDVAFQSLTLGGPMRLSSSFTYVGNKRVPKLASLVFPERGVYRPGEVVHLTAMVRGPGPGPDGEMAPVPPEHGECDWTIEDPRRQKVASGRMALGLFGTVSLDHTLPKDAPLGVYTLRFECNGATFGGSFNVQEFRSPEFKTKVDWMAGNENILVFRKLGVQVAGEYLFGAPMVGAKVEWRLSRTRNWYTPPGNEEFTFRDIRHVENSTPIRYGSGHSRAWDQVIRSGDGVLDETGLLNLEFELTPGDEEPQSATFSLEAEVIDANFQSISGRASVVAHWAERYVGLQLSKYVTQPGEIFSVSSVVTRLSGERLDADVTVTLNKTRWWQDEVQLEDEVVRKWKYEETAVATCNLKAGAAPGQCQFAPAQPGDYVIRATTADLKGRKTSAAESLWVAGEAGSTWWSETTPLELVADKKSYVPGDTARILVRSPFPEASGVFFVAREGVASFQPMQVHGGTAILEVPVLSTHGPELAVEVALFTGRTRKPGEMGDVGRPNHANKRIQLPVSLDERRISMVLDVAPQTLSPGDPVRIKVHATDAKGQPVKANVVLALVDEGVLSLTQYVTPNPLKALYAARNPGTITSDNRLWLIPRGPETTPLYQVSVSGTGSMGSGTAETVKLGKPGAAGLGKRNGHGRAKSLYEFSDDLIEGELRPSFYVRSLFETTAYFNGALQTDEKGNLEVTVKMPDNLTRFRIMAVAADSGLLFGSTEGQVTTRLPIMIRPSMPRFLNLGDRFDATAVVTNVSGVDTQVKVKAFAQNLDLDNGVVTVEVPSGGSRTVSFKASAKAPGPATVRFAAVSMTRRPQSDAADITIPTLVPATAEATATYGAIETSVGIPFTPPKEVLAGFGGLEFSLSSTALTGLQDALDYLVLYPFDCSEQLSSRILAVVSLKDIIADFRIGGLESADKVKELLNQASSRLTRYVREDGGMGFWPGATYSWLHASAFSLYALDSLQKSGIPVSPSLIRGLQNFLFNRLQVVSRPEAAASGDPKVRWEALALDAQALAVVAMARSGAVTRVAPHLDRLVNVALKPFEQGVHKLDLPVYASAWLAQAMHFYDPKDPRLEKLLQAFSAAAVETTSSFAFSEGSYESMQFMWYTPERTTAVVLQTLLQVWPQSPLIEKSVRGLIRSKVKGRWENTQANAFALLALNLYYRTFESAEPDFVARIWLGQEGALAKTFKGRSMDVAKAMIPMAQLLESDAGQVTVAKEGTGRLYYRLGLRYAPTDLVLEPLNRGFLVERTYLQETSDQPVAKRADGSWAVSLGDYVRVRVRITAPQHRYFVAVVDPMPAGLESVNEAFATSAKSRPGNASPARERWGKRWWGWWSPWDFEEKRDDRVQLFQDRMYGGVYEYTYLAKATASGRFVAPPARAEEMYEPETFGRSGTDIVVVEPNSK